MRSVIVLVSRLEKSGTGDRILSNGKGHFGPTDRNDQTGQSGQQYSFPNILVGPNQNGLFHLMYQTKFLEFWFEWKAPFVPVPEVFVLERVDSISIWQHSNRVNQRVQDNSTSKECPKTIFSVAN